MANDKRYFLWLLFSISKIRKEQRKILFLDQSISGQIDLNTAYSFSQWAMSAGLLHLGVDHCKVYIYENKTKNVDNKELQEYLRQCLHMNK